MLHAPLTKPILFHAGVELAQKIMVLGISMNIVTYLVGVLNLPTAYSATIVTNCLGTMNLVSLLGGFLADVKLGRYLTIAISATISAVVSLSFYVSDLLIFFSECVGSSYTFVFVCCVRYGFVSKHVLYNSA